VKAEASLFHPGTTGEGKTGRVNASESSYASLSAAPQVGGFSGSANDVSGAWMVLLYRDVPDFAVLNHSALHRRRYIFDKVAEVVFVARSAMDLH